MGKRVCTWKEKNEKEQLKKVEQRGKGELK